MTGLFGVVVAALILADQTFVGQGTGLMAEFQFAAQLAP